MELGKWVCFHFVLLGRFSAVTTWNSVLLSPPSRRPPTTKTKQPQIIRGYVAYIDVFFYC